MKFYGGNFWDRTRLRNVVSTRVLSGLAAIFCGGGCLATENTGTKTAFHAPSEPMVLADLRDALREVRQNARSSQEKIVAVELLLKLNKSTLFQTVSRDSNQTTTRLQAALAALSMGDALSQRQEVSPVARGTAIKTALAGLLQRRLTYATNPQAAIKTVAAFALANPSVLSRTADKPQVFPLKPQIIASLVAAKASQSVNLQKVTALQISVLQASFSSTSPEARIIAIDQFAKANSTKLQEAFSKTPTRSNTSSEANQLLP